MTKEEGISDKSVTLFKALQLGRQDEIVKLLSEGFCGRCRDLLQTRFEEISSGNFDMQSSSNGKCPESSADFCSTDSLSLCLPDKSSTSSGKKPHLHEHTAQSSAQATEPVPSARYQMNHSDSLPPLVNRQRDSSDESEASLVDEFNVMSRVRRKKDFEHFERIEGKPKNIVKGLELHTGVFNEMEQKKIVDYVYEIQRLGQKRQLRARTYSEPKKWMPGKGRVTIQFGCCYNYAADNKGNKPGILQDEEVDPLPPLFKTMIKRLVRWHVLPPTCVPNSCIVNIYDKGDCIPPHIDHHDFVRPFCTVSFLTQCNILFGSYLKIEGAGQFSGQIAISLPVGSVLVLNGNGADVAKHCVPAVPAKRISITFRKMDDSKLPFRFRHDPELQGLQPLVSSPLTKAPTQHLQPPVSTPLTKATTHHLQPPVSTPLMKAPTQHLQPPVSTPLTKAPTQHLQPPVSTSLTKATTQQVPHPNLIHQNKRVSGNGSEGLLGGSSSSAFNLGEQEFPPLGGSKPNKNRIH